MPADPRDNPRGRGRGVLVEAALAVALLVALSLFASGHARSAGSVPPEPTAVSRWTSTALPVLNNLTFDSRAIEASSDPGSADGAGPLRDDAVRYEVDLAAAERLPAPPDGHLARVWRSTLAQLTSATPDLQVIRNGAQGAMARAHVRFAAVETVLLEFAQAIRPAQ